jgi:hypothetical protein
MSNEHAKAELAAILNGVQDQLRTIADIHTARAELLSTASVLNNRVTITLNADGTVVETKFGAGIEDLSYAEIARAVTDAAQRAAADLARRNKELMAPLQEKRARMPKLSDMIEGLSELKLPQAPEPSLAPPGSPERRVPDRDGELRFADVEDYRSEPGRRVTDTSW